MAVADSRDFDQWRGGIPIVVVRRTEGQFDHWRGGLPIAVVGRGFQFIPQGRFLPFM